MLPSWQGTGLRSWQYPDQYLGVYTLLTLYESSMYLDDKRTMARKKVFAPKGVGLCGFVFFWHGGFRPRHNTICRLATGMARSGTVLIVVLLACVRICSTVCVQMGIWV